MQGTIIVFTDLDGTLLDHQSYSYAAAAAALDELRQRAIPLVLCSSKTAAEIFPLRAELGFAGCPAIVENGAGLLPANDSRPAPAPTHARLLELVDTLPAALRGQFSGFSSWSMEQLRANTGLDEAAARRAARRDYTEPGLWCGNDAGRRQFVDALARHGIEACQGGRFLTLGFAADKSLRMGEIIDYYRQRGGEAVSSIALGDAPNDVGMLRRADIGVIVPNPGHAGIPRLAEESRGRIIRAGRPGPAGWSDSLLRLLPPAIQSTRGN